MDFNQLISRIRTKLPIQNPLHSFVHNNILLMFEDKEFHTAVTEAGKLYHARPYWPEHRYTDRYKEGKITEQDILLSIDRYMEHYKSIDSIEKLGLSHKEFFYRLMFAELAFNDDEAQPDISEKHLWNFCQDKAQGQSLVLKRSSVKWRAKEYWEKYHNESFALSLQPDIIRLISSYLDQGQSFWGNPFVHKGFWTFFTYDVKSVKNFSTGWRKVLVKKVERYELKSSEEVIQAELTHMGIPEEQWENYLLDILFDLKGWSGMVNKLEVEPWQAPVKAPEIKLTDYMAALLLMESSIDTFHSETHSLDLSLIYGRQDKIELNSFQIALSLYQITNSFKLDERWMLRLDSAELLEIINEIDGAEHIHRIRLWHEAYEHHFHREAIQAIGAHSHHQQMNVPHDVQVLFCIDDREESFRRHLEEVDPKIKTFGVVGFFGIDMKFASHKNQRLIAQCPPVVNPSRVVREIPNDSSCGVSYQRWNIKRAGGDLKLYYHSRTLVRGFLSTLILGVASIVPMFLQVFFPKQSLVLRRYILNLMSPEPETDINIELGEPGYGYSKAEMAKIVEGVIRWAGIEKAFSPLVVLVGHGSSSTNNPFKQAYGCGACGGNAGIPNSRAFAKMANDPLVRAEVKKLGITIPDETFFISGYHDTCTDEVHFFNTKKLPAEHIPTFTRIKQGLKDAGKRNAYERCQRFNSFNNDKSGPDEAIRHVKERALDLAQPRPEYGHSSNALAIVARRELTKGMFLNRRSFLHTYDWELDPDGTILAQVVLGGIPVAVNINMDYYFSCVDNDNFGCGSKLPLNMTSLLGVMTGSQGDLRIGLARQMIEIHEPIRNLTMIEAPLERVQKLFDGHPRLRNMLYNHWMRLVVMDPETHVWSLFGEKDFGPIKFDKYPMKHFDSSVDLIDKTHSEEDFAEIG